MQIFAKVFLLSCSLLVGCVFAGELILAELSLDQATKKVIEQDNNKVLGAETEVIDGKKVHVIKVLTADGRVQYVKVDMESGQLIK